MGSIAFYKDAVESKQKEATRHAGALLKNKYQTEGDLRTAVCSTLDAMITDANEAWIVCYEWENRHGARKTLRLHTLGSGLPVYQLKDPDNNQDKGHLILDIEQDRRFDQGEKFLMNICIPRRAEQPNSWEYFAKLLDDIDAENTDDNKNYLRATLTFSRCA